MAGPLSGARRDTGDVNLTGGASTNVSREFAQGDREVRRSVHSDRPQRTGTSFAVSAPPAAKKMNQKAPSLSNLRTKSVFKAKRKRK